VTLRFSAQTEEHFRKGWISLLEVKAIDIDVEYYIDEDISLLHPLASRDPDMANEINEKKSMSAMEYEYKSAAFLLLANISVGSYLQGCTYLRYRIKYLAARGKLH
jgi:hypothetical protein